MVGFAALRAFGGVRCAHHHPTGVHLTRCRHLLKTSRSVMSEIGVRLIYARLENEPDPIFSKHEVRRSRRFIRIGGCKTRPTRSLFYPPYGSFQPDPIFCPRHSTGFHAASCFVATRGNSASTRRVLPALRVTFF